MKEEIIKDICTKAEFWIFMCVGVICVCLGFTCLGSCYFDYHTARDKTIIQNIRIENLEERIKRIEAVTKTYPSTDIEEALEGKGNGNPDVK